MRITATKGARTKLETTKKSLGTQTKINSEKEISINTNYKKETYKCWCCEYDYSKLQGNFTPTNHPLFKKIGFYPVCKRCSDSFINEMVEFFNNEEKAIEYVCMMYGLYFNESPLAASKKISEHRSRFHTYSSKVQIKPWIGKSWLDVIKERNSDAITSLEDLENAQDESGIKIKANSVKNWGFGFSPEDYDFLNNQLSDWKARCVVDGKSREGLVKDLCILELQKNKALLEGKIDIYQKLVDTCQKTLDRANLTPKQEDANDKNAEKPIGVMIDMFENEMPIPEPYEEWKDVDGIMKLIQVYFIGHLCKMLGLKNKYSHMYEEEMDKYRVTVPELEDSDSEDIYEYLLDNGFTPENKDGESNGS